MPSSTCTFQHATHCCPRLPIILRELHVLQNSGQRKTRHKRRFRGHARLNEATDPQGGQVSCCIALLNFSLPSMVRGRLGPSVLTLRLRRSSFTAQTHACDGALSTARARTRDKRGEGVGAGVGGGKAIMVRAPTITRLVDCSIQRTWQAAWTHVSEAASFSWLLGPAALFRELTVRRRERSIVARTGRDWWRFARLCESAG